MSLQNQTSKIQQRERKDQSISATSTHPEWLGGWGGKRMRKRKWREGSIAGGPNEKETEGSLSSCVHAERKAPGQETGSMNVWFQWKTLDATDKIFLLLGNLVCSHIIAPDSLLCVSVCLSGRHTHTHTSSRCFPPVILANFGPQHKVMAGEGGGGECIRGRNERAQHVCVLFVVCFHL